MGGVLSRLKIPGIKEIKAPYYDIEAYAKKLMDGSYALFSLTKAREHIGNILNDEEKIENFLMKTYKKDSGPIRGRFEYYPKSKTLIPMIKD